MPINDLKAYYSSQKTRVTDSHFNKRYFLPFRDTIGSNRGPSYVMAPPTVRTRPTWYLPLMSAIIRSLTGVLRVHSPTLYTLRAFIASNSELDSDGIHFTALSGIGYVLHLIDQSR